MSKPLIPRSPASVSHPRTAHHTTYSSRSSPPSTILYKFPMPPGHPRSLHVPAALATGPGMASVPSYCPQAPTPSTSHFQSPRTRFQTWQKARRRPLLRFVILLVILLPFPPLLSLLYFLIGHAILRIALRSPLSVEPNLPPLVPSFIPPPDPPSRSAPPPWSAPFFTSINAGVTGGTILAIPTLLTILFILYPLPAFLSLPYEHRKLEPVHVRNEDFFDDSDSEDSGGKSSLCYALSPGRKVRRASTWSAVLVSAVLLVCLGGATCPLGIVVIRGEDVGWSAGKAALTGLLGGGVFAVGAFVVGIICLSIWPGMCVIFLKSV